MITLVVILVTLAFRGLTLSGVMGKLNPTANATPEHEKEETIQRKTAHHSLEYPDERYGKDHKHHEYLKNLRSRLHAELNFFDGVLEPENAENNPLNEYQCIFPERLEEQRRYCTSSTGMQHLMRN